MANIEIYQTTSNDNPQVTDLVPFSNEANNHETCNTTFQGIIELLKKQIAFQPNNDVDFIDLSGGNVTLTNPAATTFIVSGQVNSTTRINMPVSNANNSWPIGSSNITFINDGTFDVLLRYNSGSALTTLKANLGVVQLTLTDNASSNGIFSALKPLQAYNDLNDLSNIDTARTNLQTNKKYQSLNTNTGDVTLTNPMPSFLRLLNNDFGLHKVILPSMNTSTSLLEGDYFWFQNLTATDQEIYAQDGSTLIFTAPAYTTCIIALIDNSTANGSFDVNAFANSVVSLYQGGTGAANLSDAQANLQITGRQDTQVYFRPASTNGAPLTQTASFPGGMDMEILTFSDASTSYAIAQVQLPSRYDKGVISVMIPWYCNSSDAGAVVWYADAAYGDPSGTNFGTLAFGTAQSATASLPAGLAQVQTNAYISNITPGGAIPSGTTTIWVRIYRQGGVGSDTLPYPAIVMQNCLLIWNASQGNDS